MKNYMILVLTILLLPSCYTKKKLVKENIGDNQYLEIILREGKGTRSIIGTLMDRSKKSFTTFQIINQSCDSVILLKQQLEPVAENSKKVNYFTTRYLVIFELQPESTFQTDEEFLFNRMLEQNKSTGVCHKIQGKATGYKFLGKRKTW